MHSLPGYDLKEKIYEGAKRIIYKGIRGEDQKPVILKLLKSEYPSLGDIARLRHEYEILKNLTLDGVVKAYGLKSYQGKLFLILEDFGGQPLRNLIFPPRSVPLNGGGDFSEKKAGGTCLKSFLEIALQLSKILGEIHKRQIIHKDIKPANIIINVETGQIKVTDFGLASLLFREEQRIGDPQKLEGTLPYMSPEQTGRMNRTIDYRTDFYSLGVTFYEMLTARLPFHATDPMEMVHCHIARRPIPPDKVRGEIPEPLSEIVIKLLAKIPEERYQSAYGLKFDLEECLTQWKTTRKIENFVPGQKDSSDIFHIPEKLYGRDSEIKTLLTAFERVSGGAREWMLVSGYSGIGKSALIQETHKPIVRKRGYFISGKFDQYKRNIPYASLIQSFQGLVQQLITESEEKLQAWKEKLLSALGANGKIIIDVIPEVELIIGKQPDVPELHPTETQNRFEIVIQEFVQVFARAEHPLVIFLDDLQWADSASLKLIRLLLTGQDTRYFLMIGAYRDNEVDPTHPFMMTLDEMKKLNVSVHEISLPPLDIATLNQLISDTLDSDKEKSNPLSDLVFAKTAGNPFFVKQFLGTLHNEGLLEFDLAKGCWQWDIGKIEGKGLSDNVVELMADKIQKLSSEAREILKLSACIGNNFDLKTLSIIHEHPLKKTSGDLWEALKEGLVLPADETYKYAGIGEESQSINPVYHFLHDRVQQAAYTLIPERDKKKLHLKIGRLLWENTPGGELEEKSFSILKQFNNSIELVTDFEEKKRLAQINLMAGKKALASTAFEPALKYLAIGMELLEENCWETQYELTLPFHMARAECEYLCGNFEKAEQLFDAVLEKGRTVHEKARVYNLLLPLYTNRGENQKAVELGIQGLKLFGINFPEKPSKVAFLLEVLKVSLKLRNKRIETLVDLQVMSDKTQLSIMGLLNAMISGAYFTSKEVLGLVITKMVNISLKHGNTDSSAYAYSVYGMILGAGFGKLKSGYEFGNLAIRVAEKFRNINFIALTNFVAGCFTNCWRSHFRTNLDFLSKAFPLLMDCGNLIYAGYCVVTRMFSRHIKGDPLEDIYKEGKKYLDFANKIKLKDCADFYMVSQQKILSLKGPDSERQELENVEYDEEQHVEEMKQASDQIPLSWYYICKTKVFYLFENYESAMKTARESEKMLEVSFGQVFVPMHYFYYSLTITALYPKSSAVEKKTYRKILKKNQKELKRLADNCPENFLHQYLLIEAQIACILGNETGAMGLFDRSIKSAQANEFLQDEAIANELMAKFYMTRGFELIARAYMVEARFGYLQWGAATKIRDLDKKYPQFTSIVLPGQERGMEETTQATFESDSTTSTTGSSSSEDAANLFDLNSVIKSSQALSGEIHLDRLLGILMKTLMENAGARKGFIVLERDAKWVIEAEGSVNAEEAAVLQSIPLEAGEGLPKGIVKYVQRTGKSIILDDATAEGIFTSDPYIEKEKPKSVMCVPLIHQRKLTGILYMENNLIKGAFTQDRLELLRLLTSQVAISIENAFLYHTLEQKVEKRTRELRELNELKNKFLGMAAHDLRNPLSSIYGFSEMLVGGTGSLSKKELETYHTIIKSSAQKMIALVDNFLDISVIESGKLRLDIKPNSLKIIIEERLQIFGFQAGKKNITVHSFLSEVEDFPFDKNHIAQVLDNLISNAIKFSPPGSNIYVNLKKEGEGIEVSVRDEGPGVSKEDRARMFGDFEKLSATPTSGEKSTGLGLAIIKKIIEAHRGNIKVDNAPGSGAVFSFWLPK